MCTQDKRFTRETDDSKLFIKHQTSSSVHGGQLDAEEAIVVLNYLDPAKIFFCSNGGKGGQGTF